MNRVIISSFLSLRDCPHRPLDSGVPLEYVAARRELDHHGFTPLVPFLDRSKCIAS
jgi:hypothetical protein